MLDQVRADAARERDELRELLDDRARMLTEARDEQRQRAERAERELDQARANVLRPEGAETGATAPARRNTKE